MVTDLTQKMVAMSFISRLTGLTAKLNAIAKIRKYRNFHEGHHFILMAMEVHDAPQSDMDRFIKKHVLVFSLINKREVIYLCFFCIQFLK